MEGTTKKNDLKKKRPLGDSPHPNHHASDIPQREVLIKSRLSPLSYHYVDI